MAETGNNNSSRPGIVIVAIVAILLIAGMAIWYTMRERSTDTSSTSSTTATERDVETVPVPSGTTTESNTQGNTNEQQPNASDSTGN